MRKLCIALLCAALAGLCGCGEVALPEETTATSAAETTEAFSIAVAQPQWGVSIEQVDLRKPENKKYLDWAKEDYAKRNVLSKINAPECFDIIPYLEKRGEFPYDDWATVGEYGKPGSVFERQRDWNDTKELVIRDTYKSGIFDGDREFFVRDKATGKTALIDAGSLWDIGGVVFDEVTILSDKQFLYHMWILDSGEVGYFLYDLEVGYSVCVALHSTNLSDLGKEQYLWCENHWYSDNVSVLHMINMRDFNAGKKDAKRTLINFGSDYGAEISHLSMDKRFVHMELYRYSDNTRHRGIYNIDTGEQVAFFEYPDSRLDRWTLINDEVEYAYYSAEIENGHEDAAFYIIRYDRTGKQP